MASKIVAMDTKALIVGAAAGAAVAAALLLSRRRPRGKLPKLTFLDVNLAVIRLPGQANLEEHGYGADARLHTAATFYSVSRTSDETSVVLDERCAPAASDTVEKGWIVFKLEGPLDFALIGILSRIASTLAAVDVSIFAISTFDTDYVLLKKDKKEAAIAALTRDGYIFD